MDAGLAPDYIVFCIPRAIMVEVAKERRQIQHDVIPGAADIGNCDRAIVAGVANDFAFFVQIKRNASLEEAQNRIGRLVVDEREDAARGKDGEVEFQRGAVAVKISAAIRADVRCNFGWVLKLNTIRGERTSASDCEWRYAGGVRLPKHCFFDASGTAYRICELADGNTRHVADDFTPRVGARICEFHQIHFTLVNDGSGSRNSQRSGAARAANGERATAVIGTR